MSSSTGVHSSKGGGDSGGVLPLLPRSPRHPSAAEDSREVWMRALWRRYCAVVDPENVLLESPALKTLWELWVPVLKDVPLYPCAWGSSNEGEELTGSSEGGGSSVNGKKDDEKSRRRSRSVAEGTTTTSSGSATAVVVPRTPTHVFLLMLREPSDRLRADMMTAVEQKPQLMQAVLTFFYSWLLFNEECDIPIPAHPSGSSSSSSTTHASMAVARHTTPSSQQRQQQQRGWIARHGLLYGAIISLTAPPLPFVAITASRLNQLVCVSGSVIRLSIARLECAVMSFCCQRCGAVVQKATDHGSLVYPTSCHGKCRGYQWAPMPDRAVCNVVQRMKLQEAVSDSSSNSSSGGGGSSTASRLLEVELRPPLIHCVAVGDSAVVCGWLEARQEGKGTSVQHILCLSATFLLPASSLPSHWVHGGAPRGGEAAAQEARMLQSEHSNTAALLMASGVVAGASSSSHHAAPHAGISVMVDLSHRALFFEMVSQPSWFARLTSCIAPGLLGLQTVKEALLLAVLSGSGGGAATAGGGSGTPDRWGHSSGAGKGSGGGAFTMRQAIHVLLIGDPGMGKSQLLQAVCTIAPRSTYVSASASTSCGLTLTFSRDSQTGGVVFEAGAVVQGDGGITAIDEIDKGGSSEHTALLEVMEQESISIAKAGVLFSMPVHTTVIAAGNPVGGSFLHGKVGEPLSVSESSSSAVLGIPPALLTRFDVVYCLRDNSGGGEYGGADGGASLTQHILGGHRYSPSSTSTATTPSSAAPLPLALLRSFLVFARTTCSPSLSPAAAATLKTAYLEARQREQGNGGGGGVTPRLLQALVRLTTARARAELRNEATVEDAIYATNLMRACRATLSPPEGSRGCGGVGVGGKRRKANLREAVVQLLKSRYGSGSKVTRREALEACEEVGSPQPERLLAQINEYGDVLQSGDRFLLR